MTETITTDLPPGVTEPLDELQDALGRLASGELPTRVVATFDQAVGRAFDAAAAAGAARRDAAPETAEVVDVGDVIRARARELREDATLTQGGLAEHMSNLGFAWKRLTVTEVENGSRRLSLDELIALAGLYGVPLVRLLDPVDDRVRVPSGGERSVAPRDLRELLIGRGGKVGRGGATWEAARAVGQLGDEDKRPAAALWRCWRRRAR